MEWFAFGAMLLSITAVAIALGVALGRGSDQDRQDLLDVRMRAVEKRLGIKNFQNSPPRDVLEMRDDWSVEKYR